MQHFATNIETVSLHFLEYGISFFSNERAEVGLLVRNTWLSFSKLAAGIYLVLLLIHTL